MTCAEIRDRIPEFVAGEIDEAGARRIQDHLEKCEPCTEELELVGDLALTRTEIPAGFEAHLLDVVRTAAADDSERRAAIVPLASRRARRFQAPTWALGAAAVLALAVGTPLLMDRMQDARGDTMAGELTEDVPIVSLWSSDDGLMAGAPMLDDLSDEELLALLDGMEEDA